MGTVEMIQLRDAGFCPLVDFESWRVGALQFQEKFQRENLCSMQKHEETDEVFVLLQGVCLLFDGGCGEKPERSNAIRLQPLKVYNVKKNTWHTHMLSRDGVALVVENANTRGYNSPNHPLTEEQQEWIRTVCVENGIEA